MVKLLRIKMMLLLAAVLIGAGTTWADDTYVKISSLDDLESDATYILADAAGSNVNAFGVLNDSKRGTIVSSGLSNSNNTITVRSDATQKPLEFTITKSGDYYTLAYGESPTYLGYSSGTAFSISTNTPSTNSYKWNIAYNETYYCLLINNANNNARYILRNGTSAISAYSNSNLSSYGKTTLYKKVAASANATSVTINASGITNTDVYTSTAAGSLSATIKDNDGQTINGATVTWSSETESVATIASDGTVTLVGEGTTIITASYAGVNGTYDPSSATYTLTVTNSDPNVPGSENNPYSVAEAIAATPSTGTSANVYIKGIVSAFYKTSIIDDGSNYRYYISDDGTTTNQLLVYKGKKNATDNFSSADDLLIGDEVVVYGGLTTYNNTKEVAANNYIVSRKTKANPALSFGPTTSFTCDLYTTFTAPALTYAAGYDGTISYESSQTDVATVDANGEVTLVGTGTTTITATGTATATFNGGSASYTLTVTKNEGVDPVGPAASNGYYELVTDASTLADGDQIIIAYASDAYAMSTEQKSSNRGAVSVTVNSDGTITATDDTQVITLEGETNAWYFNVGTDAYLYASSNSSNQLKTTSLDSAGDAAKATIEIASDGTATINFQRENGRNWLKYNPNNNSPLFACYADNSTTGSEPQIYRYVAGTTTNTTTVTLSAYGYKTLVTTENFTVSDATAYIVTAATTTSVTTQAITVVPANAPVFLKGTANAEVTLTFTEDDADDVSDNLLAVSDASQGNGCYVLAVLDGEVGFYKWAGGSLGAGRVILPASEVPSGARQFLPFNETTGIDEIVSSKPMNGEWYDLQGRRVVKAQKGLYIMNGKKVLVK